MTKEEKEILFKTLCALLPYKPKVHIEHDFFYDEREPYDTELNMSVLYNRCAGMEIKPYLRRLLNITKEEEQELLSLRSGLDYDIDNKQLIYNTEQIDWLNEHHFDYRGLIEKGLAIEIKQI